MNKLFDQSAEMILESAPTPFPVNQGPARRYLAICLPRLASDRIIRKRAGMSWRLNGLHKENGLIIVDHIRNGWRVSHLDEVAEARGLGQGQSLSDARAIYPDIEVIYGQEEADQQLLEAIADWCERYTPLVALDKPDGIILDITGCSHLFGGEKAMAQDVLSRLFHQGFAASAAIAATPGAAWAASRFAHSHHCGFKPSSCSPSSDTNDGLCIVESGQEARAMALLPVAGLRLDVKTLSGLARLGLGTIGQVMARARAPLARRFGKELLLRLDQALGHVEESIVPRMPVPALVCERRLAEPVMRVCDIETLIGKLGLQLCRDMKERAVGARHLELVLFRVDGKTERLCINTATALREPDAMVRLFRERIAGCQNRLGEALDAGLGYETARLSILQSEAVADEQVSLEASEHHGNLEAAKVANSHLVDKLGARLGRQRIITMVHHETHLPENLEAAVMADVHAGDGLSGFACVQTLRPLRLFRYPEPVEAIADVPEGPPLRFRWRRKLYQVMFAEGPERIGDEWWRPGETRLTRDYFRIEDHEGLRFWLYRQGLYARETASPKWFMHGVFA